MPLMMARTKKVGEGAPLVAVSGCSGWLPMVKMGAMLPRLVKSSSSHSSMEVQPAVEGHSSPSGAVSQLCSKDDKLSYKD